MLSILFVGSCDVDSPDYEKFVDFCRAIGACASQHHRILIAGTTARTADMAVVSGALEHLDRQQGEIKSTPRVTLYHTEGDESEVADTELLKRFKSPGDPMTKLEEFRRTSTSHNYSDAFQKAVRDCDVVTLIGGSENSEEVVEIAIRHQKPVLGFTRFCGAGEKANTELRRVYQLLGITDQQTRTLRGQQFDAQTAQSYLDLVAMAHEKNPWAGRRVFGNVAILIGALSLLLILWLAASQGFIQTQLAAKDQYVLFFVSCILAALIGSYSWFFSDLRSPGEVAIWRLLPRTARGVVTGLAIAGFARMIIGMVYQGDALSTDISFSTLVVVCSLIALLVAAFGLSGLKALDDVLGKAPVFDKA